MDENQIKEKLSDFGDIKQMLETPGGKKIVEDLRTIAINITHTLTNSYKQVTHIELIGLCAKLEAHISLLQLLTGIEDQIKEIESLYPKK